jgi:hypothetical protein
MSVAPPALIETRINPTGENVVRWDSAAGGMYHVYLHYNREGFIGLDRDFLNWKQPLRTNWEASLAVLTNGIPLITTNIICLSPGKESREGLFFSVSHCFFLKAERVLITITPREPPPFGAVTSLSISPDPESVLTNQGRQIISNLLCAVVAVVLMLYGFILERRLVKREVKG